MDSQSGKSVPPGRIVADAIAAAAAHKSNGLMKLVRHRDETLQLMLSSVEHEWSSSPPEAVRGMKGAELLLVCNLCIMAPAVDQADHWFARHEIISNRATSSFNIISSYHHDP